MVKLARSLKIALPQFLALNTWFLLSVSCVWGFYVVIGVVFIGVYGNVDYLPYTELLCPMSIVPLLAAGSYTATHLKKIAGVYTAVVIYICIITASVIGLIMWAQYLASDTTKINSEALFSCLVSLAILFYSSLAAAAMAHFMKTLRKQGL